MKDIPSFANGMKWAFGKTSCFWHWSHAEEQASHFFYVTNFITTEETHRRDISKKDNVLMWKWMQPCGRLIVKWKPFWTLTVLDFLLFTGKQTEKIYIFYSQSSRSDDFFSSGIQVVQLKEQMKCVIATETVFRKFLYHFVTEHWFLIMRNCFYRLLLRFCTTVANIYSSNSSNDLLKKMQNIVFMLCNNY